MFLHIVELAQSLGVEESVVEGWVRDEGLPHITERGRLLFDRVQVAEWAASRGMAAKVGFLAPTQSRMPGRFFLEPLLRKGGIRRDVAAANVMNVFSEMVGQLPGTTPPVRQLLQQRLRSGTGVSWAAVGGGLALPHLRTPVALGRDAGALAILLLRDTLTLPEPAPDEQPVNRLMFFIAPSPRAHLEILAQLSSALSRGQLRQAVMEGLSDQDIFGAVAAADHQSEEEAAT